MYEVDCRPRWRHTPLSISRPLCLPSRHLRRFLSRRSAFEGLLSDFISILNIRVSRTGLASRIYLFYCIATWSPRSGSTPLLIYRTAIRTSCLHHDSYDFTNMYATIIRAFFFTSTLPPESRLDFVIPRKQRGWAHVAKVTCFRNRKALLTALS